MHLFLIRHGETEHNIAGLLAGVTDSKLTVHGMLQAERLASYLINDLKLKFQLIFASDLRRAYETAGKIAQSQNALGSEFGRVEVVKSPLLREQDFGSLELVPWSRAQATFDTLPNSSDPSFVAKETKEAMRVRADIFLDDYLLPNLAIDLEEESCVAIVSHGLFLAALWKALLARFGAGSVSLDSSLALPSMGQALEFLPAWSNTGYLELHINMLDRPEPQFVKSETESNDSEKPPARTLAATMTVRTVNGKTHLLKLKRTGGGVGSATHDERQQRLDGFFKKPKTDE